MSSDYPFFTVGMGAHLRQIRLKSGLTQDDLAVRMGKNYRGGKSAISNLELGRKPEPYLSTIYCYLRACGAPMQELLNLLVLADKVRPDTTPIEQAELPSAVKGRLKEVTGKQTEKFQRRIRRPRRGLPQPIAKQQEMVTQMGRYRVMLNLIEHAVEQCLVDEGIEDAFRPAYLAVARHVVGILWQAAKSEPGGTPRNRGRDSAPTGVNCGSGIPSAISSSAPRIPPALAAKLSRKDAVWQQQILDMDLVRRVQGLAFIRFRELCALKPTQNNPVITKSL